MSENIVIGDVRPRIQAVGDGILSTFIFPFAIFKETDLEVYLDDARQLSGYSVSGAGQTEGGSVIFDVPPPANTVVTLRRYLTIERMSDFAEGGAFHAAVINQELDYLVALSQQNADEIVRSVTLDPTDGDVGLVLPLKEQRAHACLVFDEEGAPVVGPNVEDIAQAQANAGIATQAAAAAQVSASSAAVNLASTEMARDLTLSARDQAVAAAQNTFSVFKYTASGGETTLSGPDDRGKTLIYTPGVVLVDMNGALWEEGTDYVAADGTSLSGFAALADGDVITIRAFGSFSITTEMDALVAEGASQIANVQAEGIIQTASMQTYAQQMADIVNNTYSGAFFEMDGNGDVMATLSPIYSETYELDINGDIQPL
ncbi:hypothetical protein GCM10011332_26460 [Terasakiella brassicae]|uniref:Tail fiber protein n=1 Tax=Terasakiella brassicae TaxID=1634917 RepID=A0A917C752_9PROT|nr:hypothetical protein [Terasakiella brassicae]GGF71190.1 hypothetical protein GCM10011332_26460 [Terasakiella brassicae]